MQYVCLLFPPFIALYIYNNRNKKDAKEVLFMYPIFSIIVNTLCILITCLYVKNSFTISEVFDNPIFCCKYLLLASVISMILPLVIEFLNKNINIKVTFRKNVSNEK